VQESGIYVRRGKGKGVKGKKRGMSRRDFLRFGGAGIAGAALLGVAGCGGGGGSSATSGTLRWSMWSGTPEETEVWQGLARDVNRRYPEIRVNLETTTFTDYWDKLSTQIASKTGADLVAVQSLRMPGFAARNAFQPLQPFIDKDPDFKIEDFFEDIRQGLSADGELYALGYDIGPLILYYNRNLFEKAGVEPPPPDKPMSWDEFREKAADLTKAEERQYGFVMQPTFDPMVPWLWSGGGGYMNEAKTECLLDAPESVEAMKFVVSMFTEDKIAAPITDLANPNFAVEEFYGGKVGMHLDGPWQFINIDTNSDFDWDIAPMPAGAAGSVTSSAGSGFGISNSTKNPEAAWTALKTITSTESLKKLVEAGRGFPARQSAVEAFESSETSPQNVALVRRVLNGEVGESRSYETTATWQEITVMLTRDFNPVFLGRQSVEETVKKVVPEFDRLLAEHQKLMERRQS
jgi:multiple sugar transport system substrate-binding protein